MQCKNCGANYKTRELVCPYCHTENIIGRLWKAKRTEAELEYEKERKAVGKKYSVYIMDRVLNRALIICCLIFVVILAGVCATFFVQDKYREYRNKSKEDEIISVLEEYYAEGRFLELNSYMDKNGIRGDAYYPYTQITSISYSYEEYLNCKYAFMDMSYEEKIEDDYYIEYAIRNAIEVYTMDFGVLSELHDKNKDIHSEYCREIESFLTTVVGFTDDDFVYIKSEDTGYINTDDIDRYVMMAKERLGEACE